MIDATPDRRHLEFAREAVVKELFYRRDRVATLFSWTSNLLIAITGFVVVLASRTDATPLSWWHRLLLDLAVAAITLSSIDWFGRHFAFEKVAEQALAELDRQLGVPPLQIQRRQIAGYRAIIILLALAAGTALYFF